jgi:hypothetical protein
MSPYEEERWFIDKPASFCADSGGGNYRWQRVYDAQDFFFIFGFPLSDLKKIVPLERGICPYYKSLSILKLQERDSIKGDLKIREYFDKLRSSSFKCEIKFSPQGQAQLLIFYGAGFGHGVGLCQDGAKAMADKGYDYKQILRHYYPNTEIKKAY